MEMACFWFQCHSLYWIGFHFSFWWCARKNHKETHLLQQAIYMVQNRHAGEQKSHWDKINKGNYHLNLMYVLIYLSLIGHFRVPKNLTFKARLSAKPLLWKWVLIMMQIKLIFTTKVSHLASFWKRDFLELGNGLLSHCDFCSPTRRFCTKWMASCKLKGLFTEVSIYLQVFQI